MINHYITIGNDEAIVTYSDAYNINNIRCFDIYVERPTKNKGLVNIQIQMPFCKIKESYGMNKREINYWIIFAQRNFSLIQTLSIESEQKLERIK